MLSFLNDIEKTVIQIMKSLIRTIATTYIPYGYWKNRFRVVTKRNAVEKKYLGRTLRSLTFAGNYEMVGEQVTRFKKGDD